MDIIVKIIFIFLALILGILIANIVDAKRVKHAMSFREALDLTDLPIITFRQGKERINLIIDTGSSKSVITPDALEKLEYEKLEGSGTIMGMEGSLVETEYVDMEIYNNSNTYSEVFTVVDMSGAFAKLKELHGVTVHGILGNSFFTKYDFIIDYNKLIAYGKRD
jgi:hypothetical protein